MPEFSQYQKDIFSFLEKGRGDGVVAANAGTGKTFTCVEGASRIKGSGIYLVFSKAMEQEAKFKLKDTTFDVKTTYSLGLQALRMDRNLRKAKIDNSKYYLFLKDAYKAMLDPSKKASLKRHGILPTKDEARYLKEAKGFPSSVKSLIDLARQDLIDPRNKGLETLRGQLYGIIDHHLLDIDTDIENLAINVVVACLKKGIEKAPEVIDFTDMIYLPKILGLSPRKYSWVFIDEAQDLSKAQLDVALRARARGGRILAIGDEKQSIFGFCGSDSDSFQNIIDKLNAKVLPLSICYRCPTSHLDLARKIVPSIENSPSAEKGEIKNLSYAEGVSAVQEGDLIICRVNAPLIKMCYRLIAQGISAAVRGRSIGDGLAAVVKKFYTPKQMNDALDIENLKERIEAWQKKEFQKITKAARTPEHAEAKHQMIADKVDCLYAILGETESKTPQELVADIVALFDNEKPSVILSSVHRAKGLESERVMILEPEKLGVGGKLPWQKQQEKNLHYVALTRAKKSLFFVEKDNQ